MPSASNATSRRGPRSAAEGLTASKAIGDGVMRALVAERGAARLERRHPVPAAREGEAILRVTREIGRAHV